MKKKFLISCLIAVFAIGCMITLAFFMKDQIRDWSKKHIFYKVTKQEEELSRLVGRYTEKDKNVLIHLNHEDTRVIPYKKLNDEEISDHWWYFEEILLIEQNIGISGNLLLHNKDCGFQIVR